MCNSSGVDPVHRGPSPGLDGTVYPGMPRETLGKGETGYPPLIHQWPELPAHTRKHMQGICQTPLDKQLPMPHNKTAQTPAEFLANVGSRQERLTACKLTANLHNFISSCDPELNTHHLSTFMPR